MITLPESLLVYNATEVKEQLMAAVNVQGDEVILDAANLEDIDAAGLQLLASFALECEHASHSLRLVNVSEQIRRAMILFGDQALLDKGARD